MKPSKKRAAKRPSNPIVTKLLNLKYRINDAYRSGNVGEEGTKDDKSWVMNLISDVRDNNLTKLSKEDMLKCNSMWKEYSPSRLNDWVGYKNG
jgi:hypothetical protein|tara:strand:- start:219 stop:497 length:279 start_codon:yes stop_codon:yes gene_type:complete